MTLPTIRRKKLIKESDFTKVAKRVKKSFEEEVKYLLEKKLKHGDTLSPHAFSLS